jgi:hypothetical protein
LTNKVREIGPCDRSPYFILNVKRLKNGKLCCYIPFEMEMYLFFKVLVLLWPLSVQQIIFNRR